jgi:branched-chain amino acid aminotransferase
MKQNFWKLLSTENDYDPEPIPGYAGKKIGETQKVTPEGAYTTFRTYDRYFVLNLSQHFSRLEETSRLAGKDISIYRKQLKKKITEIINAYEESESRLRITIDLTDHIGEIYVAIEKLAVPEAVMYQEGVEVISAVMHRDNPKAKLNSFLEKAENVKKEAGKDYEEILMVNPDGNILEGLSSNFYGIKNRTIFTAEEGVLSGTTRTYVLNLAKELSIQVEFQPVRIEEIDSLDEAFITSTSRSILPVKSIDQMKIGSNVPGPLTVQLMEAFNRDLKVNLEDLRS